MNTKKKILMALALVGCAILLVVGSVAVTMAYLTSTATVTNTFTVGNVTITMDETDTDDSSDGERDTDNEYHLIPGQSYTKDPIIHVAAGSETCYLFVKVDNQLADIEGNTTIADQLVNNGWTKLTGVDGVNDVWYKKNVTPGDVEVFETFTVKEDATGTELNSCQGKTIEVTAYAVQTFGIGSITDAWDAVKNLG